MDANRIQIDTVRQALRSGAISWRARRSGSSPKIVVLFMHIPIYAGTLAGVEYFNKRHSERVVGQFAVGSTEVCHLDQGVDTRLHGYDAKGNWRTRNEIGHAIGPKDRSMMKIGSHPSARRFD